MWLNRLRYTLRANAALSFTAGLTAAVFAPWVSETLGIDHVGLTRAVGIGLMVFAVDVVLIASRPAEQVRSWTRLVSAADAAWVAATVAVLAAGVLTTTGTVVAVVLGLAVADFGISQLWLRSRAGDECAPELVMAA